MRSCLFPIFSILTKAAKSKFVSVGTVEMGVEIGHYADTVSPGGRHSLLSFMSSTTLRELYTDPDD